MKVISQERIIKKTLMTLLGVALMAPSALAQEDITLSEKPHLGRAVVITASRVEQSVDESGRAISIVTDEDIEAQGAYTLSEALRNVPGVTVKTLGQLGDQSTVSIRGMRSFDTAFLIDGMPLRDASDPQGGITPFLEDLFTDNVEQVEVLRGTGSTLYGSDAIGGIIHFRMKRGQEGAPQVKLLAEGGTNKTFRESLQLSGATEDFDYFVSVGNNETDGILDPDTYEAQHYAANFGFQPTDNVDVRFIYNSVFSELDTNDTPGLVNGILTNDASDPDDLREARFMHYNFSVNHSLNEYVNQTLRVGYMDSDRRLIGGPAGDESGGYFDSQFDGNIINTEYEAQLTVNEHYDLVFGYEFEHEKFKQLVSDVFGKFSINRHGVFLENRLSFLDEALNMALGTRYSYHEISHSNQSYEFSTSYLIEPTQTRVKGHVGTGFREPSLFELFGRSTFGGFTFVFGNQNLTPEKSLSWDVGVEQRLMRDKLALTSTFFRNDYSRRIRFIGGAYANVSGGYTRGIELEAAWEPSKNFHLGLAHTTTFAESDGTTRPSVPRNLFGLNLDWRFLEKFQYNFDLTLKGDEQVEVFATPSFTSELIDQKAYVKADMKLSYEVKDGAKAWFRVDNVFDEKIIEDAYVLPGAQYFGGVSLDF